MQLSSRMIEEGYRRAKAPAAPPKFRFPPLGRDTTELYTPTKEEAHEALFSSRPLLWTLTNAHRS